MQSNGDFQFEPKPAAWFCSAEGRQAFDSATTVADRVLLLLKFLRSTVPVFEDQSKDKDNYAYRIAWIMADSMVYSGLAFSGWQNIIDGEKNPLLYWLRQPSVTIESINASSLISALRTGDGNRIVIRNLGDYEKLIPYRPENEAMFLIEREILFSFPGIMVCEKMQLENGESGSDTLYEKLDELLFSTKPWNSSEIDEGIEKIQNILSQESILSQTDTDTVQQLEQIGRMVAQKKELEAAKGWLEYRAEELPETIQKDTKKREIDNYEKLIAKIRQEKPTIHSWLMPPIRLASFSDSQKKRGIIGVIAEAAMIALMLLLMVLTFHAFFMVEVWIVLIIITIVVAHICGRRAFVEFVHCEEAGKAWRNHIAQYEYFSERHRFLQECIKADPDFRTMIHQYLVFMQRSQEQMEMDLSNLLDRCQTAKQQAECRISELEDQLKKQTLLVPEYLHLATDMALALRARRADNFKEALNLAILDEARAKEAERIEREQEAALEHQIRMEQLDREQKFKEDQDRRKKDLAYLNAERRYKAASNSYHYWTLKEGANSSNAIRFKMEMEKAAIEMLANKN